jgi:hypothetical protein
MSPFAVVAALIVLVMVAMSSGRIRSGKSSLTGSLSKELKSMGKSVKKSTSGLGKLTRNKMLIGILAGFALCWAYGKFRMEGFGDWGEMPDTKRRDICNETANGTAPLNDPGWNTGGSGLMGNSPTQPTQPQADNVAAWCQRPADSAMLYAQLPADSGTRTRAAGDSGMLYAQLPADSGTRTRAAATSGARMPTPSLPVAPTQPAVLPAGGR